MTHTPLSRTPLRVATSATVAALLLVACGGGADGTDGADGVATLMSVQTESPGVNCSAGGSRILAGIDTDADKVLAAGEVSSTQYVCNAAPGPAGANGSTGSNGSPGNDGVSTLVVLAAEPAGVTCPTGGNAVRVGKDANANGLLEAGEVSSTDHVCNGSAGAAGAAGGNGLIAVTAETPGANCTYGGNKLTAGTDTSGNGTLELAEVTSTTYSCNGAPGAAGAQGAAGTGVTWVSVNGATLSQDNTGYLATGTSEVTVTLPVAPAIGSVVRVSGVGGGGWKLAQQPGQTIETAGVSTTALARAWTTTDIGVYWVDVASSADGRKLIAAGGGDTLWTSIDSGATWTPRETVRAWNRVASSGDGTRLVATALGGSGGVFISNDSGASWTQGGAITNPSHIAMSNDGVNLVVTVQGGMIYTSVDSGATWTPRDTNRDWRGVASSADGVRLVAVEWAGNIYTSSNSGVTWVPRDAARNWMSVASSVDGRKLLAAANNDRLYVSDDHGATWQPRGIVAYWSDVASSSDGTRLSASPSGERLQTSTDSGLTWTGRGPSDFWGLVASSANGTKIFATPQGSEFYHFRASTTTGTAGYIAGQQNEAIELQHIGNGTFNVLSYVGGLEVH